MSSGRCLSFSGEYALANQLSESRLEHLELHGESPGADIADRSREGDQHLVLGEYLNHGLAPVGEKGEWAGLDHQRPESMVWSFIALQEGEGEVIGLVGNRGASIEQPEVQHAAEQRPAELPCGALFQQVLVGEDGNAPPVDENVKLLKAILFPAKCEPGQKLL